MTFLIAHPNVKLVIIDTLQRIRKAGQEQCNYATDYETVCALKKAETCHYMMMALVSRVLAAIREYCAVHGDTLRRQTDIIAARVKTYINAHFEEDFSLQDISDALQVSPYYLAHIFKEQTGCSPKQYTLRRRLGEAQTLLITTRRSITDIALGVGFGNLSLCSTSRIIFLRKCVLGGPALTCGTIPAEDKNCRCKKSTAYMARQLPMAIFLQGAKCASTWLCSSCFPL